MEIRRDINVTGQNDFHTTIRISRDGVKIEVMENSDSFMKILDERFGSVSLTWSELEGKTERFLEQQAYDLIESIKKTQPCKI